MDFVTPTPDKGQYISARFVRYLDDMEVPDGWLPHITHRDLLDVLRQRHPTIDADLIDNPGNFDAGSVFNHSSLPRKISVAGRSETLNLPARGHMLTAREYTVGLVRKRCPSHDVEGRTE